MVNVAQALGSTGGGAALYARASAASVALSSEAATTEPVDAAAAVEAPAVSQRADLTVTALSQAYKYNSFEFTYRQDFGKIVLLRQKPDTGEVVQQFPSEYYLKKYADSQRVAQSAAGTSAETVSGGQVDVNVPTSAGGDAGGTPPTSAAPAPAPAPAISAAPSLPGGSGASSSPVNLTV
ncbi:hypothetical protein [Dongia sp.]|uniref:hypothetical protein n=1 Tax=Dongia sp. TaxID=1977262 RepID=UPI0035AF6EE7